VSTNDVWEAAEKAFVLMIALHQEMKVLFWLQDISWLSVAEEFRKSRKRTRMWKYDNQTLLYDTE
jgi:hypothetical protein